MSAYQACLEGITMLNSRRKWLLLLIMIIATIAVYTARKVVTSGSYNFPDTVHLFKHNKANLVMVSHKLHERYNGIPASTTFDGNSNATMTTIRNTGAADVSDGVDNASTSETLQISKMLQEQRRQEIKRLCLEEFKIQPLLPAEDTTDIMRFRERLQTTFVNDDYKLLVTVVYKTGSEGWKKVFKQLYERGQNEAQKALKTSDDAGLITLADVKTRFGAKGVADRLKNYFSVIFVRHPYSRILSAYRSKLTRLPNNFYVKKARDIIRRVRSKPLPPNETPDLKFAELVQFVANGGWDEHWCPIFNDKKPCHLYYDFVGHLETFETDIQYLFQLLGIDDIVDFPDCGHATGSEELAVFKDYFSNISQPLLAKLNGRYKNDFKIFGYHLPRNNSDLNYEIAYDHNK